MNDEHALFIAIQDMFAESSPLPYFLVTILLLFKIIFKKKNVSWKSTLTNVLAHCSHMSSCNTHILHQTKISSRYQTASTHQYKIHRAQTSSDNLHSRPSARTISALKSSRKTHSTVPSTHRHPIRSNYQICCTTIYGGVLESLSPARYSMCPGAKGSRAKRARASVASARQSALAPCLNERADVSRERGRTLHPVQDTSARDRTLESAGTVEIESQLRQFMA